MGSVSITGSGGSGIAGRIEPSTRDSVAAPQFGRGESPNRPGDRREADRVEFSDAARRAGSSQGGVVDQSGEIRADLVARVRAEIAAGTYENEERVSLAVDAVADALSRTVSDS